MLSMAHHPYPPPLKIHYIIWLLLLSCSIRSDPRTIASGEGRSSATRSLPSHILNGLRVHALTSSFGQDASRATHPPIAAICIVHVRSKSTLSSAPTALDCFPNRLERPDRRRRPETTTKLVAYKPEPSEQAEAVHREQVMPNWTEIENLRRRPSKRLMQAAARGRKASGVGKHGRWTRGRRRGKIRHPLPMRMDAHASPEVRDHDAEPSVSLQRQTPHPEMMLIPSESKRQCHDVDKPVQI